MSGADGERSTVRASRRAVLMGSVVAVGASAVVGRAVQAEGTPAPTGLAPRTEYGYQPVYFTAQEWAVVGAFVDRLIPADEEGPGALEAHVPEFIDRQMMRPYGRGELWYMHPPFLKAPPELGSQSPFTPAQIYRKGIAALDAHARQSSGQGFAALGAHARDTMIAALEAGKVDLRPVSAKLLFGQFLKNCKEGYFADPVHGGNHGLAAWKMIGFPGARADFTDWVDRYGARYPFDPIGIGRTRNS